MRLTARWLIIPALGLLVTAIVVASPSDEASLSSSWGFDDPQLKADRDKMDAHQNEVGQRIAYKNALITELLAGRATLSEVTDEFLRLNQDLPTAMVIIRAKHPVQSDEELSALNVLDYVAERIKHEPYDPVLLADLYKQFLHRFGHDASDTTHH